MSVKNKENLQVFNNAPDVYNVNFKTSRYGLRYYAKSHKLQIV